MTAQLTAHDVIFTLQMQQHPEGGWYVETFADEKAETGRSHSTAIYYLLEAGQVSHWHRVDSAEVWHWYKGAPLELKTSDGVTVETRVLGATLEVDERPQAVVPRWTWQSARSLGEWTLVGCTVAPGFRFSDFELAPKDWSPGA
ncbi:cupin [Devosia pacifica]|uniref:Cupin n=1 Tax=Devosia pacifica TaxID=1335967 RepID=A0A918SCH2_9HYPH|nr:cupin domain-containing protein [Devosia pacifica]GHA35387.1 cupin [Devosia pacifica]